MSYQSPLHIVKDLLSDPATEISSENLLRLRKRLLAELDLSGETSLRINQRWYTKDEIIKTIDQLLSNQNLPLHSFIFRNPFLLQYLEDDSRTLDIAAYLKLVPPADLRPQLEEVIAERLILQFRKSIGSRAFSHSKAALEQMGRFPEYLKLKCYDEAHRALYTLRTFLYELENKLHGDQQKDILFLSYESWAGFLNALPEEFDAIKYDLVNRTINIVVAYHKSAHHDQQLVNEISTVLTTVHCEADQARLIASNHKIFSKRGGIESISPLRALKIFAIILIAVINVARTCSREDEPNYRLPFQYNDIVPGINMHQEKADNLSAELRLYREAIRYRARDRENLMNFIFMDSLKGDPGRDVFEYAFKTRNDSVDRLWKQKLAIENRSGSDLILLSFDPGKTNVRTCFIRDNAADTVAFTDGVQLIFYFGNTLMRAQPNSYIDHDIPGYYECFKESGFPQIQVLNTSYEIVRNHVKNRNSKKVYPLVLGPAFITERADSLTFKAFSLRKVDG